MNNLFYSIVKTVFSKIFGKVFENLANFLEKKDTPEYWKLKLPVSKKLGSFKYYFNISILVSIFGGLALGIWSMLWFEEMQAKMVFSGDAMLFSQNAVWFAFLIHICGAMILLFIILYSIAFIFPQIRHDFCGFIFAAKYSKQLADEKILHVDKVISNYDMNRYAKYAFFHEMKRFLIILLVLIVAYPLVANNYVYFKNEKIRVKHYFHSEQDYGFESVKFAEITAIRHRKSLDTNFVIYFDDGDFVDIWQIAYPTSDLDKLLAVKDMLKKNNIEIKYGSKPYVTDKRRDIQREVYLLMTD